MNQTDVELQLRSWGPGDEDAIVKIANNRNVWRNMTNRFPHPYSRGDAGVFIAIANDDPVNARNFALIVGGEIVGGAGFSRLEDLHTRTAEIGYWVAESHWGRGIATQALRQATQIAFSEYDFVRLQAGVLEWNPASCRVLEKAGYRLEARLQRIVYKDGLVCDKLLYARLGDD